MLQVADQTWPVYQSRGAVIEGAALERAPEVDHDLEPGEPGAGGAVVPVGDSEDGSHNTAPPGDEDTTSESGDIHDGPSSLPSESSIGKLNISSGEMSDPDDLR